MEAARLENSGNTAQSARQGGVINWQDVSSDIAGRAEWLYDLMIDDRRWTAEGLLPALRWYVKEYQQKCGIEADLSVNGLKERLSPEAETALYRIIQESLTNTAKH